MATIPPWPQHHQRKESYQFDRRRRARRRESSSEVGGLNRKLWTLDGMIEEVEGPRSFRTGVYFGPSKLARMMKELKLGQLPA